MRLCYCGNIVFYLLCTRQIVWKTFDGIYLFSWVEEACNGGQGTILINTNTMHDCGFGFSGTKDGLRLDTMGAYARNAGIYDIKKFFAMES